MSTSDFGDLLALHAITLLGAKELFKESQVRSFGLIEAGELEWGWLTVQRMFRDGDGPTTYELVVKDALSTVVFRCPVNKDVVVDAIDRDISVIANALANTPKAVEFIALKYDSEFQAKADSIRLALRTKKVASGGKPKDRRRI